jgi:uncharacterized protein YbjT (DUF2867 family)
MSRKVVLVTGAGGFIGRWSVPPLIERGYEVHAVLSRSSKRDIPTQLEGAVVHAADLLDLEGVLAHGTRKAQPLIAFRLDRHAGCLLGQRR